MVTCFVYPVHSQTDADERDYSIDIEFFRIFPARQVVYCEKDTIYYFDDGGHGHGYVYRPCEYIDFNTTNIIFMGRNIIFKEDFRLRTKIPTSNIPTLKVIYHSIASHPYGTTIVLSPTDSRVYILYANEARELHMDNYRHIRQLFFKQKRSIRQLFFKEERGKYFVMGIDGRMYRITIRIDAATLQHVFCRYYTDKNGLYYFDNDGGQKLETSNGTHLKAVLHEQYFVYGDAAYLYGEPPRNMTRKDLRLNANEINLIRTEDLYINDSNKLFRISHNGYIRPVSPADVIKEGAAPQSPIDEWKFFYNSARANLIENTLYDFRSSANRRTQSLHLIKTPDGFYGISSYNAVGVKFDDVMIYNVEIDDYEPIEIDQFRQLSFLLYIYKNQLYYADTQPVETELDVQRLQPIRLNGRPTQFFTDGTYLVGGNNFGKTQIEERGGQTWRKAAAPMFSDVDWESLQVVYPSLMIDKNNIYRIVNSNLQIVPIKDLGIEVIVVPVIGTAELEFSQP